MFHYVLMESVQGIFIAPTHREVARLSGSVHPQLIRNFHHCCLSIRAAFQQSLPTRVSPTPNPPGPPEALKEFTFVLQGRRAAERPRAGGWGLGPIKEHGVLFQCKPENWADQRKPAPTMTYWVIGYIHLPLFFGFIIISLHILNNSGSSGGGSTKNSTSGRVTIRMQSRSFEQERLGRKACL